MSMQAQAWAIRQTTGSPSAKATLWSIANYANDMWAAWPKQSLIAVESEQSEDSVGKRIRELAEKGLLRRIKLKRGGRRTVDFLILPPSPLYQASLDEIGDHLPSGCVPMPESEPQAADADAPAGCGSEPCENFADGDGGCDDTLPQDAAAVTLPQSAAHAPAHARELVEPFYEPRVPPKAPPASGEGEKVPPKEDSEPIGFATFWQQYPDHETDNRKKAAAAFVALPDKDRSAAVERVSLYAAQIAKTGRRPVGAWRWLSDRRFSEYAPGAQSAVSKRWFVPEASEPWAAACALGAVAFGTTPRIPQFWGAPGGASVPIALMDNWRPWRVPYESWVFVERGTPQYGRWVERIAEIVGRAPVLLRVGRIDTLRRRQHRLIAVHADEWTERDYDGLMVPLEWPPGRHAKPVAGPSLEKSIALTESDHEVLANL